MRILIVQAAKDNLLELEKQLRSEGHTTLLTICSSRLSFTNNHGQDVSKIPAVDRWWTNWRTIDACLYELGSAWIPLTPGSDFYGKEYVL